MKEEATPTKKPSLNAQLMGIMHVLGRYMTLWFVLLLLVVYGFVLFQIQGAQSAQPTEGEIASQLQSIATPHVDPNVVQQMQNLQDHSVNVRTLFDQARSNPFQE